jgi:quinolinate synthase
VDYIAANEEARCGYMAMITPAKVLRTLETGQYEVTVAPDIIEKARIPIERMIAVG